MAFTGLFETSNWREWPEPFRSWNTLPSPGTPDFNITQYPKQTDACGYPETFWRQVDDIREYNEFLQLVFDVQWWDFKGYCHEKGIALLGDVPIYVGMASADTWSHPELFQITVEGRMNRVAGVPPDAFNPDGQRWDAPLYDWPEHERTEFNWWIHRIGQAMKRFDALRLDHFIGFYNYYSFPGELANKVFPFELPEIDAPCFVEDISDSVENVIEDLSGEIEMVRYELGWTPGPQKKLFNALFEHFPREKFLAEDLGVLNAGVHRLREHYSLPGMKVLQFEFDHRGRIDPTELWEENSVACTGTHDTPTVIDWLDHLEKTGPYHWDPSNFAHVWHVLLKYQKNEEKVAIDFDAHPDDFLPAYDFWRYSVIRTEEAEENDFERGIPLNDFQVRADVIALRYAALRAVMQSKSYVALFPMQDILGLGASARMNFPGKVNGNWNWRLDPTLLTDELVTFLRQLTLEGDRIGFCPVMS